MVVENENLKLNRIKNYYIFYTPITLVKFTTEKSCIVNANKTIIFNELDQNFINCLNK